MSLEQKPRIEEMNEVMDVAVEQADMAVWEKPGVSEPLSDDPEPPGVLTDVLENEQRAYDAYIEAQRQVTRVYKDNERRTTENCRLAEQQIRGACDDAIRQALQVRDRKLGEAQEARAEAYRLAESRFDEARDAADSACEEAVAEALKERDTSLGEAISARDEVIAQAWQIYSKLLK